VGRHAALVARAERAGRGAGDDRLDAPAALAADQLGVLLAEPAPRAEERGLDRRAAHAEALADLAVAEALELAHHEDLVVGFRQAAESAAEMVERHLLVDGGVGRRPGRDQPAVVGRGEARVRLVGDPPGPLPAPSLRPAG